MSPFLGLLIDRKGLRSVMILTSSVMCFVACIWNAAMPVFDEPSWWCLPSLLILGLGYSIYGAALWSCVPYTVPAKTIGSAYGLTTSI
jgi:MFS family permease